MSLDWTEAGIDQIVTLVPTWHLPKDPDDLATSLPTLRLNLLNELESSASNTLPSNLNHDNNTICPRCVQIGIHAAKIFETDRYASHLGDGKWKDIKPSGSSNCPLCHLLSLAPLCRGPLEAQHEDGNYSEYGLFTVNLLSEDERISAIDYTPDLYSMGLTISLGRLSLLEKHLKGLAQKHHRHHAQGMVLPVANVTENAKNHSPFLARIINPNKIDYSIVHSWIRECKDEHVDCKERQGNTKNLKTPITVVDCQTGEFILLPSGAEYLALSYVWGKKPLNMTKSNTRPKNLPRDAPRTVRDAMAVTMELQYRYLWVDRYCINQQDEVEKAAQLAQMDMIYEIASVTIVAAAGMDDQHGIPGAGTQPVVPRISQDTAKVGPYIFVSLQPDVSTAVKDSIWATRGWTYQEAILSTRALVFTPRQAYFICRTTHRCEVLPRFPKLRDNNNVAKLTLKNLFSLSKPERKLENETRLQRLAEQANIYARRSLTFDSDALNAFRGVLTREQYWSYFGVPLITRTRRELRGRPETHGHAEWKTKNPVLIANEGNLTISNEDFVAKMAAAQPEESWYKIKSWTIFDNYYTHQYKYDDLPGPGEPIEPSATLAFLHGLCWSTNKLNDKSDMLYKRRDQIPTWSWLSLHGGPISFGADFDGPKEISNDLLTNIESSVQVWVQKNKEDDDEWIEFNEAWSRSNTKIIPEIGLLLRLETLAADVVQVKVEPPPAFSQQYLNSIQISVLPAADNPVPAKDNFYDVFLDVRGESMYGEQIGTFDTPGWKIALIHADNYYNPEHPDAWLNWKQCNFLLLQPFSNQWKRIGLFGTERDTRLLLDRETLVIS